MTNSWSEGYFTDVGYTHSYFREVNPVFQRLCLLLRGYEARESADMQHCELGFGQGVSLAIHAAAQPASFYGTDFNPAHAAHAQALVSASATTSAHLFDDSFEQLLERTDLPQFDSITLHGIWTWVSRHNHEVIAEFARKRLKPGGILYISYNCFPGWSPAYPLRQLFALHDRFASTSPDTERRVDAAIKFSQDLLQANPLYVRAVPSLNERLDKISKQNRHYLAHEYFNREWNCMYFTDVVDALAPAKLDFACSAVPLDTLEAVNVSAEGAAFLSGIEHPLLREQARDYFVNQQFRKDLFLRGAERLSAPVQQQRLLDTRFALVQAAALVPLKVAGAAGEATLQESVYRPIVDAFASRSYAPKTLREVAASLPELKFNQLREAVGVLVSMNSLAPCQSEVQARQVHKRCDALNRHLQERALTSNDVEVLASPVLGGGVNVHRFQQMFLLARAQGRKAPAEWAQFAWQALSAQGQALIKDEKPLETPEENVAELTRQAEEFSTARLPVLKALQVA